MSSWRLAAEDESTEIQSVFAFAFALCAYPARWCRVPPPGTLVLDSLLNPLPSEALRSASTSQPMSAVSVTEGSPVVGPKRALDMLISTLREGSAPNVPPEVRLNVCALLGHLGRKGVVAESRATDVQRMTESARELFEVLAREEGPQSSPKVAGAARRALEAWA